MARVTVEDCLDKVPNRFALVMLVAKRAKQLVKGSIATVHTRDNKWVVTALREVAQGSVFYERSQGDSSIIADIEKDLSRETPTQGYQTSFD